MGGFAKTQEIWGWSTTIHVVIPCFSSPNASRWICCAGWSRKSREREKTGTAWWGRRWVGCICWCLCGCPGRRQWTWKTKGRFKRWRRVKCPETNWQKMKPFWSKMTRVVQASLCGSLHTHTCKRPFAEATMKWRTLNSLYLFGLICIFSVDPIWLGCSPDVQRPGSYSLNHAEQSCQRELTAEGVAVLFG